MHGVEDGKVVAAREFAAGMAMIAVAAFGAPMLFPGPLPAGRVLVMSVVTGILVALLTDWRARTGITAASVVIFVVFVAPGPGSLTGDSSPWPYTPLIGFAAFLGWGYRWLAHATPTGDPSQPGSRVDE